MGCAFRQHAAGFSYRKPQSLAIHTARSQADVIRVLELQQLLTPLSKTCPLHWEHGTQEYSLSLNPASRAPKGLQDSGLVSRSCPLTWLVSSTLFLSSCLRHVLTSCLFALLYYTTWVVWLISFFLSALSRTGKCCSMP